MITSTLSLTSKVVQRKGIVVSDMEGSKVMFSIEQGKYYNLGVIGGEVWEKIQSPTKISDLVEQFLSTYDVEETICCEQVLDFLTQLLNQDLIIIHH